MSEFPLRIDIYNTKLRLVSVGITLKKWQLLNVNVYPIPKLLYQLVVNILGLGVRFGRKRGQQFLFIKLYAYAIVAIREDFPVMIRFFALRKTKSQHRLDAL